MDLLAASPRGSVAANGKVLSTDVNFRDVQSAGSSSINELETLQKVMLPSMRLRVAVRNSMMDDDEPPSSILLLGIMSGNEARRRMLHCHWSRVPAQIHERMRVRFVVGVDPSRSLVQTEWIDEPQSWRLIVNVSEGKRLWTRPDIRRHQSFTGTFSTYFKQAIFLRFAAAQPEPLVARADDDAFISPHMLFAYSKVLRRMPHAIYAGVFEWISWRTERLEATGFSYGLAEARGRAKAPHRNCSRITPPPSSAAYEFACVGPIGYAKGPLLIMNNQALQWLLQAPVFARDFKRATDMAEGRLPTRKGRIDDDINLGFWMSRMPQLRLIRIRRVVWKDTWRNGADVTNVLAAHKAPWAHHDELYNTTAALWATTKGVSVDAFCKPNSPPCRSCAHAQTQRACLLEVSLDAANGQVAPRASACVRAPKRGMGCPVFGRESHPKPPSPEDVKKGICVAGAVLA